MLSFCMVLLSVISEPTLSASPNGSTIHISTSPLNYDNSSRYCQDICHSELASIHSKHQMEYAQYIANNTPRFEDFLINNDDWRHSNNVRIGLVKDTSESIVHWIDGTNFDYGYAINNRGIYPWGNNQPNNLDRSSRECVALYVEDEYRWWDGSFCENPIRFLCNSCDGELIKYALHYEERSFYESEAYCNEYLGTHLASIHSQYDFNLAIQLCEFRITGEGCFIGLERAGDTFEWSDGTTYDLGSDYDLSVWAENKWNDAGDCIEIDADFNYTYDALPCTETRAQLCAMPSLLCYPNYWENVFGIYQVDNCEMFINQTTANTDNIVISNREWTYNDKFVVEYIFAFSSYQIGLNASAGLLITDDGMDIDYIAIVPETNTVISAQHSSGYVIQQSVELLFAIQMESFYVMKVTVTNELNLTVSINDHDYIITKTNRTRLSGFIGIRTLYASTHGKSVYASGAMYALDVSDTIQNLRQSLTSHTTANPSAYTSTAEPVTSDPIRSNLSTSNPITIASNTNTDTVTSPIASESITSNPIASEITPDAATLKPITTNLLSSTEKDGNHHILWIIYVIVFLIIVTVIAIVIIVVKMMKQTKKKQKMIEMHIDQTKDADSHNIVLQKQGCTDHSDNGLDVAATNVEHDAHKNPEFVINDDVNMMTPNDNETRGVNMAPDEFVIENEDSIHVTPGMPNSGADHGMNDRGEGMQEDDHNENGLEGECTDCGQISTGRIYDEDGSFYCWECRNIQTTKY